MAKSKDPEVVINAKFSGTENWQEWSKAQNKKNYASHGTSGSLYFVGFVGSLIYWWQAATNFGAGITGLLKSMVWPAYVVYKLLESFYGVVN